jgi:FtsP/CotA-like multicopper oxidase with cupredoxin domain
MHLHGFYFKVDSLLGPLVGVQGQGPPGRMAVTERMSPFSTMSMSWVAERAGNWLFHCHWAIHLVPPARVAGALEPEQHNHALEGMAGLVMGIAVSPRPGERVAEAPPRPRKQLRLVAVQDSAFPDSAPSLRFVIQEHGSGRRIEAGPGFSPPLELTRGEPVSITVVNTLREPTAVHWHGIELESYYDGVADFSGFARRIAPVIAPGDSFEARFTPPRAGTFIYHSHVNEPRQQRGGMVGALVVREPAARDAENERIIFLKSSRVPRSTPVIDIGGRAIPDTMVLQAGRPYRFRIVSLTTLNSNPAVSITARPDSSLANVRDSLIVQWRPLAKDGADLPEVQRVSRLARQLISMGETYDFEFTPKERGLLRFEVRGGGPNGRLFNRIPIRVE